MLILNDANLRLTTLGLACRLRSGWERETEMVRVRFDPEVISDPEFVGPLFDDILTLADSEKNALGFLPKQAIRDAIDQGKVRVLVDASSSPAKLAGYILLSGVYPHAKVQQIAVSSEFRGSGVASALLRHVISTLEVQGYLSIRADVASDLSTALALYKKNGFEPVSRKSGGVSRKREIIVHSRQLHSNSLFSDTPKADVGAFGLSKRVASSAAIYALDVNVYLDLALQRQASVDSSQIFGAALSHSIRLVVSDEFVEELRRNKRRDGADPVLELALRVPRLPTASVSELDELATEIHEQVFVLRRAKGAHSEQAWSDSRHLAHASLANVSAFVTRDKTLLTARATLLTQFGIDVLPPSELSNFVPEKIEVENERIQGRGFSCKSVSSTDAIEYFRSCKLPTEILKNIEAANGYPERLWCKGIFVRRKLVAVAWLQATVDPPTPKHVAVVHVLPEQTEYHMFADYLLDALVDQASKLSVALIELEILPGQPEVGIAAETRGFAKARTGMLQKCALGQPLMEANWLSVSHHVRTKTGFDIPRFDDAKLGQFRLSDQHSFEIKLTVAEFENYFSPTVVATPERQGVIVPIRKVYSDQLLGTRKQMQLGFLKEKDAIFLPERAFVNSPNFQSLMRPGFLMLFYESLKGGGAGAITAVARITVATKQQKQDVPEALKRLLVVDNVSDFSSSDEVLVTRFDNLLIFPRPVRFSTLRQMGVASGANFVSPAAIEPELLQNVLAEGWKND